jgi:putative transposase
MARPLRIGYPGAFYHVTSRGNEQKDVFKSRRDREKFLGYLDSAVERYGAVIHVYCLMSNHYHLLLETPEGNLSQIMRHVNGAYTTYFNVKRKRSGHLFQGRYKAILIEADEYATELSRYIHMNPVKVGMVAKPEEYEWSSYRYYIGLNEAPKWLKTNFVIGLFNTKDAYRQFVEEAIHQEIENPLKAAVAATILGRSVFVKKVTEAFLGETKSDRNLPAAKKLNRPTLDEITDMVSRQITSYEKLAKKVSIYFCHRYSGARLREVGERFGMSDAAVTQASKRLRAACDNDADLRKLLRKVGKKLGVVPC